MRNCLLVAVLLSSASAYDARVKACVNLEGSPQMTERRFGLPHPLLTLRSENRRGLISLVHSSSRVPSYDVEIRGSTHSSVSDLGVLGGREGSARYLEMISAYTVAFLDLTLRGTPSPLLESATRKYPEAKLSRFDAMGREIDAKGHPEATAR